jgi:hypothetical protein
MNIALDIDKISTRNIFFLDSKSNNVLKGEFTKMIYSGLSFCLNGIYILCPFVTQHHTNKTTITIDYTNPEYRDFLLKIRDFEIQTLKYYKQMFECEKHIRTILTTQMENGWLRYYTDKSPNNGYPKPNKTKYILKISGIWETATEIGITYKVLQVISI